MMAWGHWLLTAALAAVAVGLTAGPYELQAQRAPVSAPLRVIVAPGLVLAGGTELESGIGGVAHLAVERGRHRGLVRLAVITDVAGFPDGSGEGDVSEVGILYGRRTGDAGPGRSISAGVAAVHFQRCPDEPSDSFYEAGCSTVGVPVVAEAGVGTSTLGIAVQLFGNLNARAPFAGVGVTVPLGRMR